MQLVHGPLEGQHGFPNCVHTVIKLDISLTSPANNYVAEPGLLDPDGIGELAPWTIDVQLGFIQIDFALNACCDFEHEPDAFGA